MIFCTDYWVSNEVGRVCKMAGRIEAESLEAAEAKAAETGHVIVGEFAGEEDAGPEMGGYIERAQREQDREWLESVRRVDAD